MFSTRITTDLHISRTSASIVSCGPGGTLAGIPLAPVIGRWIDKRTGLGLTATIIAG